MHERIHLGDSIEGVVRKMSGEIPGAMKVCMELLVKGEEIDPDGALGGLGIILLFDTYSIYEERIWKLYRYVCGRDLTKTVAIIRACQLGLFPIDKVQYAIDHNGYGVNPDELLAKVKERLPNFTNPIMIVSEP